MKETQNMYIGMKDNCEGKRITYTEKQSKMNNEFQGKLYC